MSSGFILALDQGTTGTTVRLFDHDGTVRGGAYGEITQHYPRPGWVEHDAREIWTGCQRLIDQAIRSAKAAPGDVKAIGITNQRETVVLWDRATGEPVANAIVWQDRRTAPDCDRLRADGLEPLIYEKTGLVLDPYFSATKIRWLLDNVAGLRSRAQRGEIACGTVDSWLTWKITGGRVHVTDYSNASRTMLYNIHQLQWDPQLLEIFDVPVEILPEVKPSSAVLGLSDAHACAAADVPVCGIAGDQQAALFGQGCHSPGLAKNTYGTGSFLLMNTGRQAVASREKLLTTIAWRIGDEPVEYALEGSVFITGAAVQWLRDGLGIIQNAAETEAMARSLAGNDGVYFVPALVGLGAPHWDAYARGLIIGLTRGTTRAHFARAALEAMCYQTRDVADAMAREAGIALTTLRADGGAVGNAFLMQFQADLLGAPVDVPHITETTALGAAYLAGLGSGFWKNREEIGRLWRLERRYEPSIGPSKRNELYARWLDAVQRCKGWESPRGS